MTFEYGSKNRFGIDESVQPVWSRVKGGKDDDKCEQIAESLQQQRVWNNVEV